MIISDRIGSGIASAMADADVIPEDRTAIYAYCYSYLLDKLIYILYIALLCILIRNPLSAVIILSVLLPLRSISGGVHADSQIVCSILSFALPPFMIFMSFQTPLLNSGVSVTIFALSMLVLFIFAPVENKNILTLMGQSGLSALTALCTFFCAVSLILGIIKYRRQGVCSSI